ncbi:MAG: outer membrane protein assembly factor BamD [Flavobacteriia bacterium]|nr:MAG: outer membrane protein assembly factor BamD [Flavobacteriia bacterium]
MLKNKIIITFVAMSFVLSSCGEFTKTLNKGTTPEQYDLATKLYESRKYNKAIQLFEKILPYYQGKPQMERIQYMMAKSKFETKLYLESAYYFERFTKNYTKSTKREDALFMAALSYYLSTPRSSLDQSETQTAINAFQKYINSYPNAERVKDANAYIKEMLDRLERKEYDIAYQYYHTGKYKAAIVAFDNFLSDNLGTSYKEDALFYKSKAAFDLAHNSVLKKKEKRIKDALATLDRLEYNFSETKYKADIEKMRKKLNNELKELKNNNS